MRETARSCWFFAAFSLSLLLFFFFSSSGVVTANLLTDEEQQEEIFSRSEFTQLDDVPVVNPTTPGSDNPYPTVNPTTPGSDNPYPTVNPTNPQAPDTTGQTPTIPQTPDTTGQTPTIPQTPDTTGQIPPTVPNTNPNPNPNPNPPATSSGGGQWCVASQGASDTALQVALDYACGYGGADCSAIQPGASCYNPNTVRDHASYAFNDYYQKNPTPTSCVFGGTASLTSTDPSSGSCKYATPKTQSISPPTYVSPPSPPSPIMTPTTPTTTTMPGGGSTDFGLEPTESPNSATPLSSSLLLLFITCTIWVFLLVPNHT